MAHKFTIAVTAPDIDVVIKSGDPKGNLQRVVNLFRGLALGSKNGSYTVDARGTATAATATVTLAAVDEDDTVTINGVVFTAKASPSGTNEWSQAGTNTVDAASLAAAIVACTTAGVKDVVTATSSGAVVTVAAILPGLSGNAIQIKSSNGTRLAVAGTSTRDSLTYLSGGAETRVSVTY